MNARFTLGLIAALAVTPALHAQNCGSGVNNGAPFASNNGFAGNMFDVTIGAQDVTIECLDISTSATTGNSVTVDVWYCPTTCVGNDMNQLFNWSLIGTATGVSEGLDDPTEMDLSGNGIVLSAGQSYGIYVDYSAEYAVGNGSLRYTNGSWGFPTFVGDDLEITCYYGKGNPTFTGSTFGSAASGTSRDWNGTLYTQHPGAGNPVLTLTCVQNLATAIVHGGTPGGVIGVVYGPPATWVNPSSTCPGIQLDVIPRNIPPFYLTADPQGTASVQRQVGNSICGSGIQVQAVDVSTCLASNAEAL